MITLSRAPGITKKAYSVPREQMVDPPGLMVLTMAGFSSSKRGPSASTPASGLPASGLPAAGPVAGLSSAQPAARARAARDRAVQVRRVQIMAFLAVGPIPSQIELF